MFEISQIFLSSNIESQKLKNKSTSESEQSTQSGQTSTRTLCLNSNISKAHTLNNQIIKIEKLQSEMDKKFEKCISNLLRQIQQKQTLNYKLLKDAQNLNQKLQQSQKDIDTIVDYMDRCSKTKINKKKTNLTKISDKKIQIKNKQKSLKKSIDIKGSKKLIFKGFENK